MGAVLSQAAELKFAGSINGTQAGTDSTAVGSALLTLDTETSTFDLSIQISGLSNTITMSHIHSAPPEANGPDIFDIGDNTAYEVLVNIYSLELSGEAFPPGELANLLTGNTYVNIHTDIFEDGEIRGQMIPMDSTNESLVNLSTRGMVNPGNGKAGLLIGGLVIQKPKTIMFRMIADSLTRFGIQTSLKDTSFQIHKVVGSDIEAELIGGNDDWREDGQAFRILMTGIAPGSDKESAWIVDLDAGSYTLSADSEQGAGIALVETYSAETQNMAISISAAAEGGMNSEFTTLNDALHSTGLNIVLEGPGPFTFFAPTDAAFLEMFSQEELDELLAEDEDEVEDLDALSAILLSHITGGSLLSTDLIDGIGSSLTNLMDEEITVLLSGESFTVENANILEGDIITTNGVIHVIDTVIQ